MADNLSDRILYCDANCLVVNKIAGEAVEGASKGMIDLPKLLADQLPNLNVPPVLPEDALALPTAVHRLDVPVSGCAAFARTRTALRFLNEEFTTEVNGGEEEARRRKEGRGGYNIEKLYWAIVEPPLDTSACRWVNDISSEFVEIVHWIHFDSRKNKSFAYDERGQTRKKAVLRCRLAGKGRDYLFLEVDLVTGRHHQIRAQFEKLGLHIKGDLKYGARRSEREGGIRLHARSLSFPRMGDSSPSGISRITVQADPPRIDNLWQAFLLVDGKSVY